MGKYKCKSCGKEKDSEKELFVMRGQNFICYSCFVKLYKKAETEPDKAIQEFIELRKK